MMKNENYEKLYFFGLVITLLLVAALSIIWLQESARMDAHLEALNLKSIAHGEELYRENCIPCHGENGEGLIGPALNNKVLLEEASNRILFAAIDAGRPGTTMPAWGQEQGGPLTQEGVDSIVDFIRAWEENAPMVAEPEFIPSPARGATIFTSACFVCHGEDGRGNTAPAINNQRRLNGLEDDWYRQTISYGRPAQGMPTWGTVLSENQIEDLIALFGVWRQGQSVLPEIPVADLFDSAVFSVSQKDSEGAIFHLERAKQIAFGPALDRIDEIIDQIENERLNQALRSLSELSDLWPLGVAEIGAPLYTETCAPCHGPNGEGGVGSQLNPNQFIQENTNSALLDFVLAGRPDTSMRGFEDRLSEAQIADLLAFLREWQP